MKRLNTEGTEIRAQRTRRRGKAPGPSQLPSKLGASRSACATAAPTRCGELEKGRFVRKRTGLKTGHYQRRKAKRKNRKQSAVTLLFPAVMSNPPGNSLPAPCSVS